MDNASPLPLQRVWQLYDLQNELIIALAKRSWTKKFKEHMRAKAIVLSRLLPIVRKDARGYVGGDEVLAAIEDIQMDIQKRIGEI